MVLETGLFEGSFLIKFFILVFFTASYLYSLKRGIFNFPQFFPLLILLLFARDILFHLTLGYEVLIISDILILIWYVALIRSFTGKKQRDLWFYTSALVVSLFLLLNSFFPLLTHSLFGIYRGDISIVYRLLIFIGISYMSAQFYSVSRFNTEDYKILERTRPLFTLFFTFYNLLMLFFPYDHQGVHKIILPLSYFMHLYVLYRYIKRFDDVAKQERQFLENNFESLFEFLRKITGALSENIDLSKILSYIVHSAVKSTNADAGVILLLNDYEKNLTVEAMDGIFPPPYSAPEIVKRKISSMHDYFKSNPISLGETVLGEAAANAEPVFIRNTSEDPRMEKNSKNDVFFISSLIAIPLIVRGSVLGVLSIIKKKKKVFFSDIDFQHIKTFAGYTSLTIENLITYMEVLEKRDMEREVEIAATIQKRLLPQSFPEDPHTEISAFSISAKGVGGDYYDALKISESKTSLVMCDVSGKGIPAALIMVMIRTIVHLIADKIQSTSEALEWINSGIAGQIAIEHFATLAYVTYDSSSGMLEFSSAGHLPLLICRGSSSPCDEIGEIGIPLGIDETEQYQNESVQLESGDSIVLYTDGITEAENEKGQYFGKENLIAFLKAHSGEGPTEITKELQKHLNSFTGKREQSDDQTFCIMKVS